MDKLVIIDEGIANGRWPSIIRFMLRVALAQAAQDGIQGVLLYH